MRPPAGPAMPVKALPGPDAHHRSRTPLAMVRRTADVLPLLDSVTLAPYERDRAARLPAGSAAPTIWQRMCWCACVRRACSMCPLPP